jgi:hypothetical protein
MQTEKFDLWCLVELFGHQKIAGKCTEQNIAGTNMLRVDVPETETQIAFTKFYGSAAIYAINPIDEQTARYYATQLQIKPITSWDFSSMIEKNNKVKAIEEMNSKIPFLNESEFMPDPVPTDWKEHDRKVKTVNPEDMIEKPVIQNATINIDEGYDIPDNYGSRKIEAKEESDDDEVYNESDGDANDYDDKIEF